MLLVNLLCTPAFGAEPEVRVGVNLELSGFTGPFGQSALSGMHMAVNKINRLGGIKGHKVQLIVRNNALSRAGAQRETIKLITEDKVVAILGAITSVNTLAILPIASERHIPATHPRITMENGQVREYAFRTCFSDPYQGTVAARFALRSLHAQQAAILTEWTSQYSRTASETFDKTFVSQGGQVVLKAGYVRDQQDYTDLIERLREVAPEVVFIPGYYPEVGALIRQAHQAGIHSVFLGVDGWDSLRLISIAGADALKNAFFINHYFPGDPDPKVAEFIAEYEKEYYSTPDVMAALGYDSVMLLADAMKRAKTLSPQDIRDALAATRKLALITGPLSYTADHEVMKSAVVIGFQEGKQSFKERMNP